MVMWIGIKNLTMKWKNKPDKKYIFYHVGKCGGSTINRLLNRSFNNPEHALINPNQSTQYDQIWFDNNKTLGGNKLSRMWRRKGVDFNLNHLGYQSDVEYIIWIRDPLTRFVSSFNSVYEIVVNTDKSSSDNTIPKKISTPGVLGPITKNNDGSLLMYDNLISKSYGDQIKYFDNANNLAEQIYNSKQAMSLIQDKTEHINRGISHYMNNGDFIKKYHKNIIFVGTVEKFEQGVMHLKQKIDIKPNYGWGNLRVTNSSRPIELSPLAIYNLKKFFSKEYECIKLMVEHELIDFADVESYFI